MKSYGVWLAAALLTAATAGCDSGGIKEGMDDDPNAAKSGRPAGFEKLMEKQGKQMTNQKKPANLPKIPPKSDADTSTGAGAAK